MCTHFVFQAEQARDNFEGLDMTWGEVPGARGRCVKMLHISQVFTGFQIESTAHCCVTLFAHCWCVVLRKEDGWMAGWTLLDLVVGG